jgi:hypothetical protein
MLSHFLPLCAQICYSKLVILKRCCTIFSPFSSRKHDNGLITMSIWSDRDREGDSDPCDSSLLIEWRVLLFEWSFLLTDFLQLNAAEFYVTPVAKWDAACVVCLSPPASVWRSWSALYFASWVAGVSDSPVLLRLVEKMMPLSHIQKDMSVPPLPLISLLTVLITYKCMFSHSLRGWKKRDCTPQMSTCTTRRRKVEKCFPSLTLPAVVCCKLVCGLMPGSCSHRWSGYQTERRSGWSSCD